MAAANAPPAWPDVEFDGRPQNLKIVGSAVIVEEDTSILVSAAFDATVNALGYVVLTRKPPATPV